MSDCREFEALIDREHAGEEMSPGERDRLAEHLESCNGCDELFDLLGALRDPVADEPNDLELAAMRRRVRHEFGRRPVSRLRRPLFSALPAWLPAAAALGGLALGWLLAGGPPSGREREIVQDGFAAPLAEGALAGDLRLAAARHASFEQAAEAPYSFRNVRLEPLAGERVRLGFDVSRHLDLEVDRDDPLLAEVLVQTMLETESVGGRLAAIEAAPERLEPKVREALVVAMRSDPNVAVRLRAQQRLAAVAGDEAVTEAMLGVLVGEESVEMRFAAVDYLAGRQVSRQRVEEAIRAGERPGDRAVLVRARDYLTNDDQL